MTRRIPLLIAALAWLAGPGLAPGGEPAVPTVEPSELSKNARWVGREVAVDDRIQFFRRSEGQGRGFDELRLRRTDVIFRLPPNLRPERNEGHAARVRGVLKKEGGQLVCDVTALTILPRDLERLDQGVAALPGRDFERRHDWARWADRRAAELDDEALRARAREVEAEALRIEADRSQDPAVWLRLARRGREFRVPESGASALAHRAFRTRLVATKAAAELEGLVAEIEAFFPGARGSVPAGPAVGVDDGDDDPAEAYRRAPAPARAALDRRLLADATQKRIEARALESPREARALADQARNLLPDRPEVAARLEGRGLDDASRDVSAMRRDEMLELAKAYEDQGQPQRAEDLKRRWLDDQRDHRLSESDAEGRLLLARQYHELLSDKQAARALLIEATKIDPRYREAEDALRRLGYRKVGDDWVEADGARATAKRTEATAGEAAPGGQGGGLFRGLTGQQVKDQLGNPDRVVRSATQGQVVEQWIYRGPRGTQYINFVRRPNLPHPTVEAYYSLP